jgi:hypothetical protein
MSDCQVMNLQGRSFKVFWGLDDFTDYVDVNVHLTGIINQLNGLHLLKMWTELTASQLTVSKRVKLLFCTADETN